MQPWMPAPFPARLADKDETQTLPGLRSTVWPSPAVPTEGPAVICSLRGPRRRRGPAPRHLLRRPAQRPLGAAPRPAPSPPPPARRHFLGRPWPRRVPARHGAELTARSRRGDGGLRGLRGFCPRAPLPAPRVRGCFAFPRLNEGCVKRSCRERARCRRTEDEFSEGSVPGDRRGCAARLTPALEGSKQQSVVRLAPLGMILPLAAVARASSK